VSAAQGLSRLPYVLLGAMTFVSFGGPFVILAVVRGGRSSKWPPDRPVEWGMIAVVLSLEVILFLACVTVGWWRVKQSGIQRSDDKRKHLGDQLSSFGQET
jgi:hypothetical protein